MKRREKRIKGYIVGIKTYHDVSKWVVRIQEEEHPKNGKKLLAVSFSEGVSPVAGLDVDFFCEDHNGHTRAIDVALRGVKNRGVNEMRRFRLGLIMVVLAILMMSVVIAQPWNWRAVQDYVLNYKMKTALVKFEKMTFPEIATDTVVIQAIDRRKGQESITYTSREAVFDTHLCSVFGDMHRDGKVCHGALYGSNSSEEKYWYDKYNIPLTIAPMVKKFRMTMLNEARTYLSDPNRLQQFYQSRKGVVLAELRKSEFRRVAVTIRIAREIFNVYLTDSNVQGLLAENLKAEGEWLSGPYSDEVFNHMVETEKKLANTIDQDLIKFAARRKAEGGEPLVKAYIAIFDDMLDSLKKP